MPEINEVQVQPDITVLEISAELLGVDDKNTIVENVQRLVQQGKVNIILDLQKVDYLNSTGLGGLIGSLTAVRKSSGKLVLCAPNNRVLRILDLTKMTAIFSIFATRDDAILSISNK
ncbi:MAG: STAS domain-containing protein [Bacteroidota bacterium]